VHGSLYYRVTNKWVCTQPKCFISLTTNEERLEVAREPKKHNHDHLTAYNDNLTMFIMMGEGYMF